MRRVFVSLAYLWIVVLWWPVAFAQESRIGATVGQQKLLFQDGYQGFRAFPDEPICILKTKPLQFLMVGVLNKGGETFLWEGTTLEKARPIKKVLGIGPPGSFDCNYAGISAIVRHKGNNEILGIYHCEDDTDMPPDPENPDAVGAYWTIAMSTSKDGGQNFEKLGQIITGPAKGSMNRSVYGAGMAGMCADHTGQYIYAYYCTHAHYSVCMARSPMADAGRPGTWKKLFNGDFSEPGLGGRDTPILPDAFQFAGPACASVQYVESFRKYVMVVTIVLSAELSSENGKKPKADKSGIYLAYSDDGVSWSKPQQLFKGLPIPVSGVEQVCQPYLHIMKSDETTATGWIVYSYTPRFGGFPPNQMPFPAKRAITLTLHGDGAGQPGTSGSKSTSLTPRTEAIEGDNVALASKGTQVGEIWANGAALIDGSYDGEPAHDGIGKQWIITFPKLYELRRIKMKLWDEPSRFYTYTIEASEDGKTFKQLVDRSKGQWKGWQVLDFAPQPVKVLRLTGLSDTRNVGFHVHELEAYCTP